MIAPGYTQPSGRKLAVGRKIRYMRFEQDELIGIISHEDDKFFYVHVPSLDQYLPLVRDNRFDTAKDVALCPIS